MASRRRPARIEPTFDAPFGAEAQAGLRLSEDDRVVPSPRKGTKAAGRPAAEGAARGGGSRNGCSGGGRRPPGRGGRSRKRRQGPFGFLRRAV